MPANGTEITSGGPDGSDGSLLKVGAQSVRPAPGTAVSWGLQVIPYVASGTKFTAIAAGGDHSLGLKSDGTVMAWGKNFFEESTVPAKLNGVIAIAAGSEQSLALVALLPSLRARVAGNAFTLSWAFSASDYVLESASRLVDETVWTPVPTTPVIVDFENVVTASI